LLEVWWTVHEENADDLFGADGPCVGNGQSAFRGAVLVVWEPFSDCPQLTRGQSTRPPWIVHLVHADGPPQAPQIA
jgi:hypothetical protein